MRLRIVEMDYTTSKSGIYKLQNDRGEVAFIMEDFFYKRLDMKNPINKSHLDYFEVGLWIDAQIKEIDGKNIVFNIFKGLSS
jgi:hypothetical protein